MAHDLTKSKSLALLAPRRRRLTVQLVRDSSTPLTMTELATRIHDCECDNSVSSDATSIQLSLRHNHLPKLVNADVVVHNEDEGTIQPERNFEQLIGLLETVGDEELPNSGH